MKQEIERKLADKEEEFQNSSKQMTKALDNMQGTLESECKAKAEVMRTRKKLEADVLDLETSLDHANIANTEHQRTIKGLVQNLRDVNLRMDSEMQAKAEVQEKLLAADRKVNLNRNCLEEAKSLLEQTDKSRRDLEQELVEVNETLGEQTCQNQSLVAFKRKGEQEIAVLNVSTCLKIQFLVKLVAKSSIFGAKSSLLQHYSSDMLLNHI